MSKWLHNKVVADHNQKHHEKQTHTLITSCFHRLYGNLPHAKREKSDTEIRTTNTAVQVKQNRHYSSRVTFMTKETKMPGYFTITGFQ